MVTGGGARPLRYALFLAGGYVLAGATYIVISTKLAAVWAESVPRLREMETLKGLVFVGVTGLLLFFFGYTFFRRLRAASVTTALHEGALAAAERRAASGLFAASVAHDLNNQLTLLAGIGEQLRNWAGSPDPGLISRYEQALERASELTRRLSQVGREGALEGLRRIDLVREVGSSVELTKVHRHVRKCHVSYEHPESLSLITQPSLIGQVVTNLVLNAAEATGPVGTILVRLRAGTDGGAVLEVHDDGPGYPEVVRAAVTGPFFTTKEYGTGLGLLSTRVCAELHRGRLVLGESPLGGALARVALQDVATEDPGAGKRRAAAGGG